MDAIITAQYQDEQWRDSDTVDLAVKKILKESPIECVNQNKMETLTITRDTRAYHLEEFCGKSLIQFTGSTKVKTKEGDILIEFGDTIIKNEDGSFSVIKI